MTDTERAASAPWRWWHMLAVDLRSLALFRIALAMCLVVNLAGYLRHVGAFLTDVGVLPRYGLIDEFNPWTLSLHLISGQFVIQLVLLLIALVLAVGLAVGYRTRLCAVGSWLLLASLHARNPVVTNAGDVILRLLLFWGMFVPLNARFSLDRALNPAAPRAEPTWFSAGSLGLVVQVCCIYWFAAIAKWDPVWISEGSAVYYALNLTSFATPFGTWLLQFPGLLRVMTFGTMVLELVGPILAFCPFLGGAVRLGVVLAFIGFHAGLGLTMHLGDFPWVCATAWLAFLPALFWRLLERARETGAGRAAGAVPDGISWLCRRAVVALRLRTPPAPSEGAGPVSSAIAVAALMFVLAWNVAGLKAGPRPAVLRDIGTATQLQQYWRLFAPYPTRDGGWYAIEGVHMDGTPFDLWRGEGAPPYERPADPSATYRDRFWRNYLFNILQAANSGLRPYFAGYLCRYWNFSHSGDQRVNLIYINYMLVLTPPPGQPAPQATKQLMWRAYCFDKPPDW